MRYGSSFCIVTRKPRLGSGVAYVAIPALALLFLRGQENGLLLAFWALLAVCAFRWFTRRPWVVLVLPVVAAAVWLLTLTLGEQVLGWQA